MGAPQGYAVLAYSARGQGFSCGSPPSRTPPGCDRGWVHLADARYEVRDTQYLAGLLVDAGLVKPADRRDRRRPTAVASR